MTRTFSFLALLFLCLNSYSQYSWIPLNGAPLSSRWDDICFPTTELGWAVNSNSQIYHSIDGGDNWTLQFTCPPNVNYLRAITFIDEQIGFVGSLDQAHYKTVDGGENWLSFQDEIPGNTPALCGLKNLGQMVYGVGAFFGPAYFIQSQDAGNIWSYQDLSEQAEALVACHFIDTNHGLVGGIKADGEPVILRSSDGGSSWEEVYSFDEGNGYVWKFFSISDDLIYASIEHFSGVTPAMLRSDDGGQTWTRHVISYDAQLDIQGIGFIDENIGWAAPRNSGLYQTLDGGQTWAPSDGPSNINQIHRAPNGQLFASGSTLFKLSEAVGQVEFDLTSEPDHHFEIQGNPVQISTSIDLELLKRTNVKIDLFNIGAGHVMNIVEGNIEQGNYRFELDLSGVAAGQYVLVLRSNEGFQSRLLILE